MRLLRFAAGELEEGGRDTYALTSDERGALKEMGLLRVVTKARDNAAWNPRGVKDAMIALGVMVDKCPDILSLGEKTNPVQGGPGGRQPDPEKSAQAAAAAMGLEEEAQ